MDFMNIDGYTILHIVDKNTRYGEASMTKAGVTNDVWNFLKRIWFYLYIGYSDLIAHDQDLQCASMGKKNGPNAGHQESTFTRSM